MNALLPGGIVEVNSSYARAQDSSTDLTVIIPTRNEAGNVASLVSRLDAALGDLGAGILFVDDSSDQTPQRIVEVAASVVRPVGLLHRPPAERAGGLGSAVLAGLRAST